MHLGLSLMIDGNGGGYDAAAVALFAAMAAAGAPASEARKPIINNTIVRLKAAGVWAKRDVYHFLAAATEAAALINWKAPGTFNATNSGATFTADRGFAGDGAATYVDSGFNPATAGGNLGETSANFSIWSRTSGQLTGASSGWSDGADGISIGPRNTSDQCFGKVNNQTNYTGTSTDGSGWWSVNRNGSAGGNGSIRRNGVVVATSGGSASLAVNSANLRYGSVTAALFNTMQIAAGAAGGSLTAAEALAEYTIIAAYMTAVGAA